MKDKLRTDISQLVKNAKVVYVTSIDEDGMPNCKAMFTARVQEGIKVHYLSTNTSSLRAAQFRENPKASLYFCNERTISGLMLTGTVEVCTDAYHRELIWRPTDTQYYPKGVTDEDYCVFKFTAENGKYYHWGTKLDFTMEEWETGE